MTIRIEPYKKYSQSAKALSKRAGILLATPAQVRKHGDFTHIINWGNTERKFNGKYLNDPSRVRDACNKASSLEILAQAGVSTPQYTTDKVVATAWFDDGKNVVVRGMLRAHSGRGILVCHKDTHEELPDAPLYTKYIKKLHEYRVHVVKGQSVAVQMKRKRREIPNEEINYRVRSYRHGWVYTRDNVAAPDSVVAESIAAVAALSLDFGAVDVGWNEHKQMPTVYEVNTAPGIENSTIDDYFEALCRIYPSLKGGMYKRRRENVRTT